MVLDPQCTEDAEGLGQEVLLRQDGETPITVLEAWVRPQACHHGEWARLVGQMEVRPQAGKVDPLLTWEVEEASLMEGHHLKPDQMLTSREKFGLKRRWRTEQSPTSTTRAPERPPGPNPREKESRS